MDEQLEMFIGAILQLDPYKSLSSAALYDLQVWARKIKDEARTEARKDKTRAFLRAVIEENSVDEWIAKDHVITIRPSELARILDEYEKIMLDKT